MKRYASSSVLDLIEQSPYETDDPVEIIRLIAREKVRMAKDCMWEGPPFDPRFIASTLGITVKPNRMPEKHDAMLIAKPDRRLKVEYNDGKPETRQNYSIAHEIIHTFFPDCHEQIRMRQQDPDHRDDEVEKLCEIGAAEILMPNPDFCDDMEAAGGVCIEAYEHLRRTYKASREATSNRMIASSADPCAVVYYKFKLKPKELDAIRKARQPSLFPPDEDFEKQFLKKLRVDYSITSDTFHHFIPRHKSLDEDSPLIGVAMTEKPFRGVTGINLSRGAVKDFYVEAVSFPCDDMLGSVHGVIAFVFPQ